MDTWQQFVEAHGQVVGYDVGDGFFIPVPPGNTRAIRVHEETASMFGRDASVRVYSPTSGEGQ